MESTAEKAVRVLVVDDERGEVDLARLAEDALFLMQSQLKGGQVEIVRELEPARTIGNGNQIQQIIVNLVVNALQAIGNKGRVAVATGPGQPGRVQLAISDNGPGVPTELAGRIFEPFFTTKPEGQGTALGLSICYRIAEEHGGSIHHEPVPGGGASFVLDFPAASAKP